MQKLAYFSIVLMLAAPALATTLVPRASPEFLIVEPSGKQILLSSLKGKVVALEFLFVGSAHCLRVAQTLNRLHSELGPRGFQPVAVAFGADANGPMVTALAQSLKLSYPLGYTDARQVDSYLSRAPNEILNIPQVVVIDRAGIIRAQSGGRGGDLKLENQDSLRALIVGLLEEIPARSKTKMAPAHRRR